MAEDQDEAQKTEEPTPKKRDDAHKKGDVARSQEVRHWFMLVSITIVLATVGPWSVSRIGDALGGFLGNSTAIPFDGPNIQSAVVSLFGDVALAVALPILILYTGALGGSLLQHKPVFSLSKIQPKFSNLSLLQGFKKMFSSRSVMEFLKTVFKFLIVGGVAAAVVVPEREILTQLMTVPTRDMLNVVLSITLKLFMGVVAIMTVIAVLDLAYQRFQQTKKLRMTKQETRDEHKQLEGDPHVKARIRQIRNERARQRMMAAVPEADVVITNPTHYAIALKYDYDNMAVPVVVAKGVDFLAKKIRELADEHDVPIVENPPLARTLYATVDIDEEIEADQYQAVAEVIGYVMRLRGKLPAAAQ